ncbi:DUF2164 domain-containing protein [Paenibacillus sp. HB172176]|uniref:DUF2164 domain-containing protein n=1 Tax=Paenibacillus sp. HB172176 TaxID=2493690 RepID=UPI00143BFC9F|nr:DUF2164 domain-containing protein [Paenibacillus sp. HB172176]
MTTMKLPRETKLQMAASLQQFMEIEHGIELGQLAGEQFIEFIMKELSPYIYNEAIEDARVVIEQRMAATEEDLYALKKPLRLTRRR